MQKKLIVLAIAAALTSPALALAEDSVVAAPVAAPVVAAPAAAKPNFTVYGKVFLNAESASNDKTGTPASKRINNDASRFGIKGSEDLGDGLKALFQYEVQFDANGNATNGLGNGTRNSGVGLEGEFGKAIIGNWDTPFKVAHNKTELFDNTTSFSALNLIGRANTVTATGVAGNGGVNYNTRQKNMIQYWSPKLSGFQAAVSYSPDSAQTATVNKTLTSLSGTYDVDAVYVALAFESRADQTITGRKDSATRLTGRYNLGDFWVGATAEGLKVNTTTAASYNQKNFELVGQYILDKETIGLSFAKAGKTNVANTGARQVSLRLGHNFSARTEVFAAYTRLTNETAGLYGFNSSAIQGTAAQQLGAKQTALGLGVIHNF
jgi:predicted porin